MSLAHRFVSGNGKIQKGGTSLKAAVAALSIIVGVGGGWITTKKITGNLGKRTNKVKISLALQNTHEKEAQAGFLQKDTAKPSSSEPVSKKSSSEIEKPPTKAQAKRKEEETTSKTKAKIENKPKISEKKAPQYILKNQAITNSLKAISLVEKGDEKLSQGNLGDAAKLYREALSLDPRNKKALLNLAAIYYQSGEYSRAKALLIRLLKNDTKNVEAYNNLAVIYLREGKTSSAITLLKKALKLDPFNKAALLNISLAYTKKGLTKKAMEYLKKGTKLYPDEYRFYLNLGVLYYDEGNVDLAYPYLSRAYELVKGKNPEIASTLRKILER